MRKTKLSVAIGAAVLLVTAGVVTAAVSVDFGAQTQQQLGQRAEQLFGVNNPLDASSTADLNQAQALENPTGLVTLAKSLKATVVSAGNAAPNLDQAVLWPQSAPTHLISINEEGPAQPSLQKINLETGVATTIVSGTDSGDPDPRDAVGNNPLRRGGGRHRRDVRAHRPAERRGRDH